MIILCACAENVLAVAIGYKMAASEDTATESKPVADPVTAELQKRAEEAFSVFDHDRNGTVDVRYGSVPGWQGSKHWTVSSGVYIER